MSDRNYNHAPGILESLMLAIRLLSGDRRLRGGSHRCLAAAERLQREWDMRHRINQEWAKRRRDKAAESDSKYIVDPKIPFIANPPLNEAEIKRGIEITESSKD